MREGRDCRGEAMEDSGRCCGCGGDLELTEMLQE